MGKEVLIPVHKFYNELNKMNLTIDQNIAISNMAHDLALEQWEAAYLESSISTQNLMERLKP
tara:strand:- start:209 stop:394 length:186 start_codon:yes stop_codon:yes gene_type:complete